MKRLTYFFVLIGLLFASTTLYSQQNNVAEQNTLRVVSYNVRNARGMDNVTDFDRVANVIIRLNPAIVAVQELDSVTNRSQQKDVLHELADRVLMHHTYAPAIDFDGGKYGVGILSKEKPLASKYLPLPGREEKRGLLIAEFERYVFACTHLSLTEEDRMASLDIIKAEAKTANKPFIIAGDLNARPSSAFIADFVESFQLLSDTAKLTFPATTPNQCIDYIACLKTEDDAITRLATFVEDEPLASDHRPVVSDIRIKASKEEIFRTKPYLQNPVDDGITVMWQTNVPTYSWVEYGTDTTNLQIARTLVDGQVICNGFHNKIRISDLTPGTTYYYRVCSQEITLYQAYKKVFGETAITSFASFKLPDAGTTDFTAIVFNDLHKQEATLKALYEQIKDIPYDFVVFNGDCIDDPTTEADALFHLSMQCETVGADHVPVIYLRGNHEIRDAYSIGLRSLFDYIGDKTYGAFNWGDTRIVMLDCGEDKPDSTWVYYGLNDFTQLRLDQVDFLKKELISDDFRKAKRRVLFNHIPIYGSADDYNPSRDLWTPLLVDTPFDVNISAHTHRYAYHPKGTADNNFPVIIGGSQRMETATVMVLQKKGNDMALRVLNTKGESIYDLRL